MAAAQTATIQEHADTPPRAAKGLRLSQEIIVVALAAMLFAAFSLLLPNFASPENLLSLLRSVSVLGIAMALLVIGRGIDLSLIATMAISVGWTLSLIGAGHAPVSRSPAASGWRSWSASPTG
ncbi:hypothetical protein LJR290_007589 [Variovorax sp. LjRoot290]|uniref:hypothetical protein n=1 Tax=Variovorax sp. LjRoot290 TaxID=3342316 RepID=UPI003ECDE507